MLTKAEIQLIKSLSQKKTRLDSGLFVAEGHKMVEEALASGFTVERVFSTGITHNMANTGRATMDIVSGKEMERISHLKTPTDILALVRIPDHSFDLREAGRKLILALDDIQDPGNLGTIIRIADWFGIEDIICSPGTADCYNPKVVQATMGALFRVRIDYVDLKSVINNVHQAGTEIYGTFLEGESIYGAELSRVGIIVMGNEGRGISDAVASTVTRKLLIPSYPAGRQGSESLNVATATAIVCSEFRRRHI